VTGQWTRRRNEQLYGMYSLLYIIPMIKSRRKRWMRHVARMGDRRAAHRVFVGIPYGKKPPRRPRRIWEGNITLDFLELGLGHRLDC
jgi:hypothetical protein